MFDVMFFGWKHFVENLGGNDIFDILEPHACQKIAGSWKHFVFVCVCVTLSLSFCKSFVINEMFVIHHLCLAC